MLMGPWLPIDGGTLSPNTLILVYIPPGNYCFSTGRDLGECKAKYLEASHYCVVCEAPESQ